MKLIEKTVSQEMIYQGKIINLRRDKAELENGRIATREVVEHPGGVCVAALTPENELLFVRQFRYPYSEVLLELPPASVTAPKRRWNAASASCGRKPAPSEPAIFLSASCIRPPAIAAKLFICTFAGWNLSGARTPMRMSF